MMPGPTALQRIPSGPNSTAATRVRASSAALDAGWTPAGVGEYLAVIEETLTIVPPPPRAITGTSRCMSSSGPSTLTARTRLASSIGVLASGVNRQIAALLTRASHRSSRADRASTALSSVTSRVHAVAPISLAAWVTSASSVSTAHTAKPSATSRADMARPRPRAAPVTTAVRIAPSALGGRQTVSRGSVAFLWHGQYGKGHEQPRGRFGAVMTESAEQDPMSALPPDVIHDLHRRMV